jgi:NADH-quinone oxidoreductase subunit H
MSEYLDTSNVMFFVFAALKLLAVVAFAAALALALAYRSSALGGAAARPVTVARLPTRAVQLAILALGFGVTGLIGAWSKSPAEGAALVTRAVLFSQLAIVVLWLGPMLLAIRLRRRQPTTARKAWFARLSNPALFACAGLASHGAVFAAAVSFRCTPFGVELRDLGARGGAAVLMVASLLAAVGVAISLRDRPHILVSSRRLQLHDDGGAGSNRPLRERLAPLLVPLSALLVVAAIPFGDKVCFAVRYDGKPIYSSLGDFAARSAGCSQSEAKLMPLQVIDPHLGALCLVILLAVGMVGAVSATPAAGSTISARCRAGARLAAQGLLLPLILASPIVAYGSPRIGEMVQWQSERAWGVFAQPFAFVLFIAVLAIACQRAKLSAFSESVVLVAGSALAASLFLGGFSIPFIDRVGVRLELGDAVLLQQPMPHSTVIGLGISVFVLKIALLCWLQSSLRSRCQPFSDEQLAGFVRRWLLPGAVANPRPLLSGH